MPAGSGSSSTPPTRWPPGGSRCRRRRSDRGWARVTESVKVTDSAAAAPAGGGGTPPCSGPTGAPDAGTAACRTPERNVRAGGYGLPLLLKEGEDRLLWRLSSAAGSQPSGAPAPASILGNKGFRVHHGALLVRYWEVPSERCPRSHKGVWPLPVIVRRLEQLQVAMRGELPPSGHLPEAPRGRQRARHAAGGGGLGGGEQGEYGLAGVSSCRFVIYYCQPGVAEMESWRFLVLDWGGSEGFGGVRRGSDERVQIRFA
eukprot:1173261-Prorocentrum_minimum.AAC.1